MKNTSDLRSFLVDRMEGLASGKESVSQSHAIASLAKQVNTTLALELNATRLLAQNAEVSALRLK